jgi:hypothetical protein
MTIFYCLTILDVNNPTIERKPGRWKNRFLLNVGTFPPTYTASYPTIFFIFTVIIQQSFSKMSVREKSQEDRDNLCHRTKWQILRRFFISPRLRTVAAYTQHLLRWSSRPVRTMGDHYPFLTTVHILAGGTLTIVNPYRIINGLHPPSCPVRLLTLAQCGGYLLLSPNANGLTIVAYDAKPVA